MNYSLKKRAFSSNKCSPFRRTLKIIKGICLFLVIGTLQSMASSSYSQIALLTIEKENTSVQEILSVIENQSEFYFTYSQNQVDVNRKTSIRVMDKSISEVLGLLFDGSDVKYTIHDRHVVLFKEAEKTAKDVQGTNSAKAVQQGRTITGTVIDDFGDPLIGVNVQIKGTGTGSITAVDGSFTLNQVPANAVLVISYIGFTTREVPVGDSNNMTITLSEDAQILDEVVVVGYGTQKKQSLTGAVTSINSDDIQTTKSENLVNNIQGKMPGLLIRQKTGEPGEFDNMISIRGYGDPIIVIDGVTREKEEFAQLSSDDIESISILKDASAAIYGMNSANGVIIVTTKKGVAQKTRVSYSGLFGMKHATGMEETVDAYTYRVMENEMARNGKKAEPFTDTMLKDYEPGGKYRDWDWIDMYMNDYAFQTSHTMSIRGGSDKVQYFTSFGYNRDNGLLKSGVQYYERYNFRTNLTAELAKGLTMNVKVSGRWDQTQRPREPFVWTFKTLLINDRGKGPYAMGTTDHFSKIGPEDKNPAALVDPDVDGYRRERGLSYNADVDLTWKVPFVDGLSVGVLGSFNGFNRNDSQLQKSYPLYDYDTNVLALTFGEDNYSNTMRLFQKLYGRLQANYANTFGKHTVNVTAVAELTSSRFDRLQGARKYAGYFSNDILNQGDGGTATNEGHREEKRLAAYLMRANYDYAGKYLLEVVVRYDGSYRYAPGHRWTLFPSFSAGWRISEENFMKGLPFITNLKLRGSYGKSGFDAGNPFQYVAGYTLAREGTDGDYTRNPPIGYVFGSNQVIGMRAPGVVLDNLSWVKSTTVNIGLDAELWNGKLFGTVEFFRRKNDGLLAQRLQNIPNTFGASFPQENINSNENMGFELELGTRGKIGKDWGYRISANYTFVREKNLYQEHAEYKSSMDRWLYGKDYRTINGFWDHSRGMWMQEYNGQFTSLAEFETAPLYGGSNGNSMMLPGSFRLVDRNGDGVIDMYDMKPESRGTGGNPPFQYGLNIGLTYKNFDLNILFQGAGGHVIGYANDDVFGYGSKTNPTLMKKYMDRWHTVSDKDDPYNPATQWVSGKYPALRRDFTGTMDNGNNWGNGAISFWNPDATYLRLKSLEIGYTLPKNLTRKAGINDCRIFLNGFNLFTWCNSLLKNADPEREERDYGASLAYPLMKSYNIGLNINF